MSQAGYTPIQLYYSTTAAATPSAGNLAAGELAVNITDGKLFYKDNGGVVRVLATAAGSAGDVVGPGSSTDNALVRFDGTTGKLVQSSVGVLDDSGNLTGLASLTATTITGALTGTVGATTPNTGAFTTLSASGTVTLNGGTANGVAYLNGSKVLTTGSALTFDGSALGVAGRASLTGGSLTGSGNGLHLYFDTGSNTGYIKGFHAGVDDRALRIDGLNLQFAVAGSEQMRLTSTGLGIGTSSPQRKLHVNATPGATYGDVARFESNGSAGPVTLSFGDSGTTSALPTIGGNGNSLVFGTGAGTKMTLDLSGNLGLGVTPSAWGAAFDAMEFGAGSGYSSTTSVASAYDSSYFVNNAYYADAGGTFKYVGSNYATQYQQYQGQHRWFTAPSGTAGNAISFTQVLTVAADGKATSTAVGVDNNFTLNSTAGAYSTTLTLQAGGGGGSTINATGASSDYLRFNITGSERARIDSSGNLLVGTTSIFGGLNGLNMQDKNIVQRNSAAASGRFRWQGVDNNNTLIVYDQNNTGVYMVNGGSSWASNSDERLKTTLIPFENAAAKVCAIRAGTGRYLTDEESVSRSFLIAQDVQAVLPEAVNVRDDEIGTLGLQYTDVIPLLTAAIQEQQTLITALTARVAALESN